MDIARLSDIKPRNIWEITDDAFDMYREHFALLASVSAVIFVPVGILWTMVIVAVWTDLVRMDAGPDTFSRGLWNLALIVPLFMLGYTFQFGATAIAVRDVLQGESTTTALVYKRALKHTISLFFAGLFVAVLGFIGLCVTIGPLAVATFYCFTAHGIVLEDRKLVDAIKRSQSMAQAYFWKSLGLFCLMALVITILSFGMQGLIWAGFELFPQAQGTAAVFEAQKLQQIVSTVSAAVVTVLVAPLPAIAITLLYYDLRVRREGLDIEFEAEQWGVPLAPDPFGGVLNPKVPKEKKGRP